MHEEDTSELVNTVLHADKVIHEQQLGWQWVAPHPELFARIGSNIGTSRGAARAANATNGPSALGTSTEGAGEGKGTEVAEGEEGSTADGIAIALRMSGLSTGEDPGVGEIGERRRTAMKLKVRTDCLREDFPCRLCCLPTRISTPHVLHNTFHLPTRSSRRATCCVRR